MEKDRSRDPERKKANSLRKDCRNTYGESPHGARKSIPRNKAFAHRKIRHQTKQELDHLDQFDEEGQDLVESNARTDSHRVGTWRKHADSPLGTRLASAIAVRQRDDGKITDDEYYAQQAMTWSDHTDPVRALKEVKKRS